MKETWKVTGKIMLWHNDSTIDNKFPETVPLKHVQVKVSAREKILMAWGPWNSWDTVFTNSDGTFTVTKEKDKSNRQFKIEVLFKDDSLKIYPENDGLINDITELVTDITGGIITDWTENGVEQLLEQTSRLAYDVRWYTVYQESGDHSHDSGTINIGYLTFGSGSQELDNPIAHKHAMVWFVYKEVFAYLNSIGQPFGSKTIALKYPHDNPLVSDNVEAPYCNPANQVIFVIRNKQGDWMSINTILHELMHVWAYQHCSGELSMATQLALHGSTHDGIQAKSFTAFHEGFAEWASNRLFHILFDATPSIYGGVLDTGEPFSRSFLCSMGVEKSSDSEHSEYGWISFFNMLMTEELYMYDFNESSTYAIKKNAVRVKPGTTLSCPALTFGQVLDVFNINTKAGLDKVLQKDEMNFDDFLARANALFSQVSSTHVTGIKKLLDVENTQAAWEVLAAPVDSDDPKDFVPPKTLRTSPIVSQQKKL